MKLPSETATPAPTEVPSAHNLLRKRPEHFTIVISQEDIEKGVCRSSSHCAISLALLRMGFTEVSVSKYCISSKELRAQLSSQGTRFISNFDAKKKYAKPVSFDVYGCLWEKLLTD